MANDKRVMGTVTYDSKYDEFVIDAGYPYCIHKERIDTHEKLVIWITHLATKTWATKETLSDLITLVHKVHGLKIYGIT